MMAGPGYLVSARKYRPRQFGELVVQDHVARTLQNALKRDRLAHAYLFSGPRGVGKTTAARILAKAVNCETKGPEPCRDCATCKDFEAGRSFSIFEIDAASNNKVEDIRDLQETVLIPPQGGRKKVYIVDEVHMLSKAAFNALLKTLEEPPPHVLFIFATTEPHKVLPTILSRCQRFDFKRIPVPDMVAHLRKICQEEGITSDEESLMLLARKGDGALRDALSAFDQAVALLGGELEYGALSAALGVVDIDLFFEATDHVLRRDRAGMLRLANTLIGGGYDIQEFLGGLAEHLRNLLVAKSLQDPALIEASEFVRQRYMETSAAFAEATLLRLLMAVEEAQRTIVTTTYARLRLELALLKMASMQDALVLTEALERVDELIGLAKAGRLPSGTDPAVAPVARGAKDPRRAEKKPRRRSDVHAGTGPGPARPPSKRTAAPTPGRESIKPQGAKKKRSVLGEPALARAAQHSSEGAAGAASEPVVEEPNAFTTLWPEIVKDAKSKPQQLGHMLEMAKPLRLRDKVLYIGVPASFQQEWLENQVEETRACLKRPGAPNFERLVFEVVPELRSADGHRDDDLGSHLKRRIQNEPVVRAVVEKFDAETIW